MILEQRVVIAAQPDALWNFLMDVPNVSLCVPGVESVEELDPDRYAGVLAVRVGPVGLRLQGEVEVVQRDRAQRTAVMRIRASDRRLNGSLNATSRLVLEPLRDGTTALEVHTDAAILGKLGEFGQPVIRRKADQIMTEFTANIRKALES